MPATCIIGDIHGRSDHLYQLVTKVQARFGADTQFICVGDFLDRGPDSKGVIEIAVRVGIEGILGNHEVWMSEYIRKGDLYGQVMTNPMMGSAATVRSYIPDEPGLDWHNVWLLEQRLATAMPQTHKDYITSLEFYKRIEVAGVTYWITHGGIKDSTVRRMRESIGSRASELTDERIVPVAMQVEPDSAIWIHHDMGGTIDLYRFQDGSVQVFGHSPQAEVVSEPWYIALDTGSGRTRKHPSVLSGVVLPETGGRFTITGGRWSQWMKGR